MPHSFSIREKVENRTDLCRNIIDHGRRSYVQLESEGQSSDRRNGQRWLTKGQMRRRIRVAVVDTGLPGNLLHRPGDAFHAGGDDGSAITRQNDESHVLQLVR